MSLEIKILTWWRGQFVGEDAYGNAYYQDKKPRRDGKVHRWVVYKNLAEASKVPAQWHGWLHYTTSQLPSAAPISYEWEKPHQRNLTGTIYAQYPEKKEVSHYSAWAPLESFGQKDS